MASAWLHRLRPRLHCFPQALRSRRRTRLRSGWTLRGSRAVEAFQAKHPEIKVNSDVDDGTPAPPGPFRRRSGSSTRQARVADVVFSTQKNDAAWVSKETNGVQAFARS